MCEGPMKLLSKARDIHLPSLGSKVRITDDRIEFFGARVDSKSPALGGVELHSADAVALFHRENRGVNNVHTLELVRNKHV